MTKILFLSAFISFGLLSVAQSSSLTRDKDPVIISGASLPNFSTLNPSEIVGFKYINGTWTQISVQADERALLDIVTPYGPLAGTGAGYLPPAPSASNPKIYFYCDAATHVGADAIATFDSDDELSFMAKDAGGLFTGTAYPTGVINNSCYQVMIKDTMHTKNGYVYLFKTDGTLQANAGINYLTYSSNLSGTSGFPANNNVTNAENTTITTPNYAWHFMSEWVSDELKILAGNGTDILDRHKAFFANGTAGCGRHEELFSSGENAFISCKTGPVRIIRSYMGAQSGPLTQRTHFFYESRHDIITNLRVHYIPSIYDAFDYNPNATGMIYRNNFNVAGVMVDGNPDVVAAGNPMWEHLSGTPGTLSIINRISTSLTTSTGTFTGYYDDNTSAPASNCTGTQGAWGTSGVGALFANNICTDCYGSAYFNSLETRKNIYADAANISYTNTVQYSQQTDKPFELAISQHSLSTSSALKENKDLQNIRLFPNPSDGFIYLGGLDQEISAMILVYNCYGQLVDRINTADSSGFFIKEQGVYEVIISTEKGMKAQKMVVIK